MLRQDSAQRLLPFSRREFHHHPPHGRDQVWYWQSFANFCFLEVVHDYVLAALELAMSALLGTSGNTAQFASRKTFRQPPPRHESAWYQGWERHYAHDRVALAAVQFQQG